METITIRQLLNKANRSEWYIELDNDETYATESTDKSYKLIPFLGKSEGTLILLGELGFVADYA